jgi:hypothetical protein
MASIDSINIPVSTDKYVADFLQKEYATAMFASARVLQTLYGFFLYKIGIEIYGKKHI